MKALHKLIVGIGVIGGWGGFVYLADRGEFEGRGTVLQDEYYRNDGTISAASRSSYARFMSNARANRKPVSACDFLQPDRVQEPLHQQIAATVSDVAKRYAIEEELLYAVMSVESRCRQNAVSSRGAVGLMQVLPSTARALKTGNPYTVSGNLHAGAKYLSEMKKRFGSTHLALAAYNAGPGAVEKYSGIPPYRETQKYTASVLSTYNKLRQQRMQSVKPAVDKRAVEARQTTLNKL